MPNNFPIPTYNYRVRIAGNILSFSEVSGLSVQHDEIIYRHGLSTFSGIFGFGGYSIRRGFAKPINISLKKGMLTTADAGATRNLLRNAFFNDKKFDIEIDLCDDNDTALITWKVIGAVPLKFELPSLQANSNDIAIESIELLAHNLEIV